jgi:hypothetical protein
MTMPMPGTAVKVARPSAPLDASSGGWISLAGFGLLVGCGMVWGAEKESTPERVRTGLLVVYEFGSFQGPLVTDQAGGDEPLHLKIADVQAVRQSAAELEIASPTLIRSEAPCSGGGWTAAPFGRSISSIRLCT